jgi:hypothetical protein
VSAGSLIFRTRGDRGNLSNKTGLKPYARLSFLFSTQHLGASITDVFTFATTDTLI